MAVEALLSENRDGVLVVTNNNPAARNALTLEFYNAFPRLLEAGARDPSVRAMVLTGADGFFCAGGDIRRLRRRLDADAGARRQGTELLHGMIRAVRSCPVPVIAAIEGGAAGAGVSLGLACDLVVAARDAYFAVSHVRIGLTPDGGATSFLSQSLPRQLVGELCLSGERVEAPRLFAAGLLNRLAEPGAALDEAMELARALAKGPPGAMAAIKALCASGQTASLDDQLDLEAERMTAALGGAEAREGIAAFLDKRKPDFNK